MLTIAERALIRLRAKRINNPLIEIDTEKLLAELADAERKLAEAEAKWSETVNLLGPHGQ